MTPQEFETAFPKVMSWIQRTVAAYEKVARPVASKNFRRLPLYFSRTQLEVAKFVAVDRVPLPHLSSIGITRFELCERAITDGHRPAKLFHRRRSPRFRNTRRLRTRR